MKIGIAQFYTNNIPYGEFSEKINEKYCSENGYIYYIEKNDEKLRNWCEDRSFTWIKPKLILEILAKKECDYLLFLDIDAVFSNTNKKIENFIDENYDIICTNDYSEHSIINAGVLLLKNSKWVLDFMKDWWDCGTYLRGCDFPILSKDEKPGYYKKNLWHDQTCLSYLYNRADRQNHIKIISNEDLNWREYDKNKNFIFHAFSYGNLKYRKIDGIYYELFNKKPETESLTDLAYVYYTDKEYIHNYISNYYEKIFNPIRKEIKRFCEIGVNDLASVRMWRDYFPNAEIIGCDIKDINEKEERIKIIKLDQSKEENLDNFCSSQDYFDVILDDGSHKMYDQQLTFAKLFKKLKSGGIYIIEDLHTSVECRMPEKAVFGWGDPSKKTTLECIENFIQKGKFISDYICDDDLSYLNDNVEFCKILRKNEEYFSITSIIKKK